MVLRESLNKLTSEKEIEFLRGAYFGVDGVWFLVCEDEYDFDKALYLDGEVWKRFAKILAKRVKRLFDVEGDDAETVADTLALRWTMEKWEFEVLEYSAKRSVLRVTSCPWLEGLKKSNREKFIPKICDPVCEIVYHSWAEAINPKIKVEKPKTRGKGDTHCDFIFTLKE